MKLFFKLAYFQLLWFLILYMESPFIYFICLGSLALDWKFFSSHISLVKYVLFASSLTLGGALIDLSFKNIGLISWDPSTFYPPALNQIWLIFPVYFDQVFVKFKKYPPVAFVLAFFAAPFAYISGSQLSSISFDSSQTYLLAFFATIWGGYFVGLLVGYDRFIRS